MTAFDLDGVLNLTERLMQFISPTLSVLVGLLLAVWIIGTVINALKQRQ